MAIDLKRCVVRAIFSARKKCSKLVAAVKNSRSSNAIYRRNLGAIECAKRKSLAKCTTAMKNAAQPHKKMMKDIYASKFATNHYLVEIIAASYSVISELANPAQ